MNFLYLSVLKLKKKQTQFEYFTLYTEYKHIGKLFKLKGFIIIDVLQRKRKI